MPPFSKWKVFLSLVSLHSLKLLTIFITSIYVTIWVVPIYWWSPIFASESSNAQCASVCSIINTSPSSSSTVQTKVMNMMNGNTASTPPASRRYKSIYEPRPNERPSSYFFPSSIDLNSECWSCVAWENFIPSALWWLLLASLYVLYYCQVSVGTTRVYFLPTAFNTRLASSMNVLPTFDHNSIENLGSVQNNYMAVPTLTKAPYRPFVPHESFWKKLGRASLSKSAPEFMGVLIGGPIKSVFDLVVMVFAPASPSGGRHWGGVGYVPTPFLTNPDGQTLFAAAGRPSPKAIELPSSSSSFSPKLSKKTVSFDRELVQGVYADGEICVLDWSYSPLSSDGWGRNASEGRPNVVSPQPPSSTSSSSSYALSPVIILFHGLTGGSDDSNLHYLAKVFNLKGWHVVIPVRRGCAEENITVTGFKSLHYPYGDKKDTELAVRYISRKMRGHPLFACGLSAGSNVMCNYLSKRGEASRIRGGVSIANGFCWNRGTSAIRRDHPVWDAVMSGVVYTMLCKRHSEFFAKEVSPNRPMATFGEAPAAVQFTNDDQQQQQRSRRSNSSYWDTSDGIEDGADHHLSAIRNRRTTGNRVPKMDPAFLGVPVSSATMTTAFPGSPTTMLPYNSGSGVATPTFPNSSALTSKSYKAKSVTITSSEAGDLDELGIESDSDNENAGDNTTDFPPASSSTSNRNRSLGRYIQQGDESGANSSSTDNHFPLIPYTSDPYRNTARVLGCYSNSVASHNNQSLNGSFNNSSSSFYGGGNNNNSHIINSASSSSFHNNNSGYEDDVDSTINLAEEFRLGRISSMQEYDAAVSRRVHGYNTLEEFYHDQSCVHNLHRIRVPTVFLNAMDDPLASKNNIPYHLFTPASGTTSDATSQKLGGVEANPNLFLVTTPSGGHLGWADSMWPFAEESTYMDRFIVQALSFMIHEEEMAMKKRGGRGLGI